MNNDNLISSSLYDLNIRQILTLAQSDDLDSQEFAARAIRYMAVVNKPASLKSGDDWKEMDNLYLVLAGALANDASRERLTRFAA
jgi:hypothetical protein